jgi:hypothetical protein
MRKRKAQFLYKGLRFAGLEKLSTKFLQASADYDIKLKKLL